MVQGDERYARLKHQSLFLHSRGLMPAEMAELKRQLWLRERLAGQGARKRDPHLVDRFHRELEKAALKQLTATGLFEEWLEAWEARDATTSAPDESPASPPTLSQAQRTPALDAIRVAQIREQKERIERGVRLLLAKRVTDVRLENEPRTNP